MPGSSPHRSSLVRVLVGVGGVVGLAACFGSGEDVLLPEQFATSPPSAVVPGPAAGLTEVVVFIVHAFPDTAAVDVEVEGRCLAPGLRFGTAVGPFRVRVDDFRAADTIGFPSTPGAITGTPPIARTATVVRAAAAVPCTGGVLVVAPALLPQRQSTSFVIAAGRFGGPDVLAFTDPIDATRARVSLVVRHVAATDSLDLALDGQRVSAGLAPGGQAFLTPDAGSHTVQVLIAGSDIVLASTSVTLRAGALPVLYVAGRDGVVSFVRQDIEAFVRQDIEAR
jgi:hypothetical protein